MTKKILKLKLADLDRSNLCQSRVTTDPERLEEYKLAWQAGAEFPPCIIYQDGDKYYIADGFHRIQSKMLARLETRQELRTIECEVRQGTMQDAITYSLGANLRHGLRPNTADKKRAILLYYSLKPEHCAHSNNEVSKVCGCSHTFVGAWRATCISSPIDVTFAETKIPIPVLKQTIEHLKAAQAEGKIVTTRNGKLLEQKISPKAPEDAPKSLPKEHLMLPTEAKMSGLKIIESAIYIVTTTASIIPRGTVIEGWESLTDTGNIAIGWEADTVLIANEDLIEIPYSIDSKVCLIDFDAELTVAGYSLVADDLKIHTIDNFGFTGKHSSTCLKPFIKKILENPGDLASISENTKEEVEIENVPSSPIVKLYELNDSQLCDLQVAIESELLRRGLSQNMPHLSVS